MTHWDLKAHFAHLVGDARKTPKGTLLNGKYKDTRWRHRIRYELRGQWFAAEVTTFVDRLLAHKTFFHHVRATGGSAQIIVNFLGDGYLGDTVPVESIAEMAELQLDLGLECFTVPQRRQSWCASCLRPALTWRAHFPSVRKLRP